MLLLNYAPVLRQPTGIGVYANAVLPALQQLPHVLIAGGQEGTALQRLNRLVWTQAQLPPLARRHGASLIFTPAPEGYLGTQEVPQVVMVHDLRPISHPEQSLQSLYFRKWVPLLLHSCLHVLTNSQFTAREIQRLTGLPDQRLSVTPLGFDNSVFMPSKQMPVSLERPYFLHIGQAYPHKNISRLIQAFAIIAHRYADVRLILAGKPHPTESKKLRELVKSLSLDTRIEFREYVSYKDLPDLYRKSLGFVYPSLWEGFGLPVLEAFACGVPVITSLGSGTEELARDAALLINPFKEEQIAEAMEALISQPSLRLQLIREGLKRAAYYTWETARNAHLCLFKKLMHSLQ